MTLYKIYKKCDDKSGYLKHHNAEGSEKYILYAITNDKNMMKRFCDIHNMKYFVMRKIKNIDKDEYARFVNKNRSSLLKEVYIETEGCENNRYKITTIPIVLTELEDTIVGEPYIESITDETYWITGKGITNISPLWFKKKYRKILKKFQYTTLYQLFRGESDDECDEYPVPDFKYDQLALYISSFKDIL